jgi:TPR repeat protein
VTADKARAISLYQSAARQGLTAAQQSLTRLGEKW